MDWKLMAGGSELIIQSLNVLILQHQEFTWVNPHSKYIEIENLVSSYQNINMLISHTRFLLVYTVVIT